MNKVFTINSGRSCDGCTACCEGWLTGVAYGYAFSPGIKCKFLSHKSCSIYPARPYNPCKTFQCHWKLNTQIPEWLKPDRSKIILLIKRISNFNYIRIVRTDKKMDPRINDWIKEQVKLGLHFIDYDENGDILIFTEKKEFEDVVKRSLKKHAGR